MKKFPCLMELLEEIALDNNMDLKSDPSWPRYSAELELQAQRLNSIGLSNPELFDPEMQYDNEYGIMAAGEHRDQIALVESKHIKKLHQFLNEAFDGRYTKRFYE